MCECVCVCFGRRTANFPPTKCRLNLLFPSHPGKRSLVLSFSIFGAVPFPRHSTASNPYVSNVERVATAQLENSLEDRWSKACAVHPAVWRSMQKGPATIDLIRKNAKFRNPVGKNDQNTQNTPTFSAGLLGMILTPDVSEHQQTPFRVQIAWTAGPLGSHQDFAFPASFLGGFGTSQFGFGK